MSLGVDSIPLELVKETLVAYFVKSFGEVQYSHVGFGGLFVSINAMS